MHVLGHPKRVAIAGDVIVQFFKIFSNQIQLIGRLRIISLVKVNAVAEKDKGERGVDVRSFWVNVSIV